MKAICKCWYRCYSVQALSLFRRQPTKNRQCHDLNLNLVVILDSQKEMCQTHCHEWGDQWFLCVDYLIWAIHGWNRHVVHDLGDEVYVSNG